MAYFRPLLKRLPGWPKQKKENPVIVAGFVVEIRS